MSPETNTKPLQDQAAQQQELASKPDLIIINSLAEQISQGDQADPELTSVLTQELQHRVLLARSEVDHRLESTFGKEALDEAREAGLSVSGGMVPDGTKHLHDTLVSNLKRKLNIDKKDDLPAEDTALIESIFEFNGLVLDDDRLTKDQKEMEQKIEKEQERADVDEEAIGFLSGTDDEFEQKLNDLINSPNAPSAFGNVIGAYAEKLTLPTTESTKLEDVKKQQALENRFNRVVQEARSRYMPPTIPKQRKNESDEQYRLRNNQVVENYTPNYPEFLSALKATMHTARERRIRGHTEQLIEKQQTERMTRELTIQKSKQGVKNPKVTPEELKKYSETRIFNDDENNEFRHLAREEVHSVISSINELNVDQIIFDTIWSRPHKIGLIEGRKPHPNMNNVPDRKKLEKLHANIQDKLRQPRETFLSAQTTAAFENLVERFPNAWWTNRVRHIDAPGNLHSGSATEIYSRDEVTREMDYLKFNDPQHRQDVETERLQHNKDTYTQELRNVDAELATISEYCAEKGEGLSNKEIEALLWDDKSENHNYSQKEWIDRSDMHRFVLENEKRDVAVKEFIKRHTRVESGGGIEHDRRIKLLAGPLADFVVATIVRRELERQMGQI